MTTGKTIALTRRTFVGKVMSLLFNMLSRFTGVQTLTSLITSCVTSGKLLDVSAEASSPVECNNKQYLPGGSLTQSA